MAKLVMVALTNPAPDREDDFNTWYESTHIPQLRAAIPGIGDVRRYRATAPQAAPEPPEHRYLAVYEIEADDAGQVLAALGVGVQSGAVEMTDAMDTTQHPPVTVIYEAC